MPDMIEQIDGYQAIRQAYNQGVFDAIQWTVSYLQTATASPPPNPELYIQRLKKNLSIVKAN